MLGSSGALIPLRMRYRARGYGESIKSYRGLPNGALCLGSLSSSGSSEQLSVRRDGEPCSHVRFSDPYSR